MKTSNLNLEISKLYLDNFYYLILKSFENKKDGEKVIKDIKKFEDFNLVEKNINKKFINLFNQEIEKYFVEIEKQISVINDLLDKFYLDYFSNENVFNVKKIKKVASIIGRKIEMLPKGFELFELNTLNDFKSNIIRVMDEYKSKLKNNDYFQIDDIKKEVFNNIKNAKQFLDLFVANKKDKSYFDKYLLILKKEFSYFYDNSNEKSKAMPNWVKGLLFLSPWIFGFMVFTFYPLLQTFIFSFSQVNLTPDGFISSWLGFDNYLNLTQDTDFIIAIGNYFASMIVYVPLITVFSLILALLLNTQVKGIGFFRTIFFFPVIITSGPVIKILIEQGVTSMPGLSTILNLNQIRNTLPDFVAKIFDVFTNEFIMILWYSGIQILVFITGLQRIDKGVYEASSIDGANKWEQFWKVTLPAINPVIIINVVFTVVMQSIFALNPIIQKIQSDMNDTAAGKGYQYSSALAFVYFVIIIFTLVIFVLLFKNHTRRKRK